MRTLVLMVALATWSAQAAAQGVATIPPGAAVGGAIAGGLAAAKGLSYCKAHPLKCTLLTTGALALGGAAIAGAGSASKPRDTGLCPEDRYDALNSVVQRLCKKGTVRACVPGEPKPATVLKSEIFKACAKARTKREDECFKGGDEGHRRQIAELWNGYKTCMTQMGMP